MPGPGAYSMDNSITGPKYGFGTSNRKKGGAMNGGNAPGPG